MLYHFGARAELLLRYDWAKARTFLGSLVYWHFEVMFTALPSVLFLRGLFYWCFGRCGSLNYRPLAARLEDSAAPGTSSTGGWLLTCGGGRPCLAHPSIGFIHSIGPRCGLLSEMRLGAGRPGCCDWMAVHTYGKCWLRAICRWVYCGPGAAAQVGGGSLSFDGKGYGLVLVGSRATPVLAPLF